MLKDQVWTEWSYDGRDGFNNNRVARRMWNMAYWTCYWTI